MVFVHVLITNRDGRFYAHALDFDLISVGETSGEALDHVSDQVEMYLEDCLENGVSTLEEAKREAPKEFFDKFEEAFKRPDTPFSLVKLSLPFDFASSDEQAAASPV